MLTTETVRDYAAQLASGAPTPGGGSGAALVGALGTALGEMVANFTVGKEKYRDSWPMVEPVRAQLTALRERLLDLTDQDAAAYAQVGAAYGLPRETEEQKSVRAATIQEALKAAAAVPLGVCEAAAEVLELLPALVAHGNPNLVSDAGVAADFCRTAFRCGWLNVEINFVSIKDEAYLAAHRARLAQLTGQVENTAANVWADTVQRVTGG